MTQVHIIIYGVVQGVGFRFFIQGHANRLGVVGYVKNTSNGAVEAVFQGSKKAIEEIIALCKKGPSMANVESIEAKTEQISKGYDSFSVK